MAMRFGAGFWVRPTGRRALREAATAAITAAEVGHLVTASTLRNPGPPPG